MHYDVMYMHYDVMYFYCFSYCQIIIRYPLCILHHLVHLAVFSILRLSLDSVDSVFSFRVQALS